MKNEAKRKWEKPSTPEPCKDSDNLPFVRSDKKGKCDPLKCTPETICGPDACPPYKG